MKQQKRHKLGYKERRKTKSGVKEKYEIGLSRQVSLACMDYFKREGIEYKNSLLR